MKGEKKLKKRTITILAVIILFAVAAAGIGTAQRTPKPQKVRTSIAKKGDIQSYLSTSGVVKSKQLKMYFASPQVTVSKIHVKEGDVVSAGQQLLLYDIADIKNSMEQAKLQYENAVLQLDELKAQKNKIDDTIKELDKEIKSLENSNNPQDMQKLSQLKQQRQSLQPISPERVKLAENTAAMAKLGYDSAKSRYEKLKTGIISDINGTVTSIQAIEGSTANPSQPAIIVQNLSELKVVLALGKYDSQKVQQGQKAIIKNVEAEYEGKVSFVSPSASRGSAAMTGMQQEAVLVAEVDIFNPDDKLKVDFDVSVDILLGSAENVLMVPVECIKYDKTGKTFVYIVEDNRAKQVEVELGIQSETHVQVLKGLKENDKVIQNPGISINDGTLVVEEGASK